MSTNAAGISICNRYSDKFNLHRFLLTDYQDGIPVYVAPIARGNLSKESTARVASPRALNPSGAPEPKPGDLYGTVFERGLRHMVCYLLIDALREFGVLDYSKINVPPALRPTSLHPTLQKIIAAQQPTHPFGPPASSRAHLKRDGKNDPKHLSAA
ncbi:hypothetical protein Rhopal_002738-T1 [Rhodotorula paludigena]|uniref:Uncharacterized protein n=1 Tax=Rhodotorula paludigena TaxID=86838 RepID=A0AAV5GKJ7_9BASI|nr:hypothetical protein Rhopal_002738-T1 [Rhodotorula paludigena]